LRARDGVDAGARRTFGPESWFGDEDDNTLDGGPHIDTLNGGPGNDACTGGTVTNTLTLCSP
jgi:hypothetical protein